MNRLIACILLLTCWSAQAATLVTVGTFSSGENSDYYSYSDGDPDYIEGSVNVGDIPVYGLSQFSPTLGTVTGITVTADYTMDVTANIEVYEAIESDQPHSAGFIMTEGYNTGVASLVRYDSTVDAPGHVRTLLFEVMDISVTCSAAAFEEPCMNTVMDTLTVAPPISANVFDNINEFNNLLAVDYAGTGTLDGKIFVASLLYRSNVWNPGIATINVSGADGWVDTVLNAGTVTLTYTYTPAVPLPATVWLLMTGVGVLAGRRFARRR